MQLQNRLWYLLIFEIAWTLSVASSIILSIILLPTHKISNISFAYLNGNLAKFWLVSGLASITLSTITYLIALKINQQKWHLPIFASIIIGVGIWVILLITTTYSYVGHTTIIPLAMWITWLFFQPLRISYTKLPRLLSLTIIILLSIGVYSTVTNTVHRVKSQLEWQTACMKYLNERETQIEKIRSAKESNDPEIWKNIGNAYAENLEFKYLLLFEAVTGTRPNLPSDSATGWTIEYAMYRLADVKQGHESHSGNPAQKQWELWLKLSQTSEFRDILNNSTTQKSLCTH